VLSDGERFKGFFLGVQQDEPIPEVDPTELKRFHENMSERCREAGPGVAIGLGALAPSTSGADTGPLCVRNWLLGSCLCRAFWLTGNRAQSWMAPCIESLQLFLLMGCNSIPKRSSRA